MYYFFYFFVLMFLSFNFFVFGFIFMSLGFSFMLDWGIFTFGSITVYMTLYFDWMSLLFSGVVFLISSMVVLYSYDYMFDDVNKYRFLFLVLLFVISMILMIFSLNLVSILLGWDGLGLVSYTLVVYFRNYNSYISGMLTILMNRVGDVFILISMGWLFNFGSFHFLYYLDMGYHWLSLFVFFIIIASFTKSAQIPFSSWLPAAMAAPTPVSALVHSSTLVTAGVYLLIRFGNLIFLTWVLDFFFIISVLTMLMAGLAAGLEYDLSKIIAFSTLSQLGLMMSLLFYGDFDLSYFHLLSHAFFKSLIFLCSGLIIHGAFDNQDIRYIGNICNDKPYITACFFISNMSLCGLFFLSGFYSKDFIVEFFLFNSMNFCFVFIYLFSVALTLYYTSRLLFYVLFGNELFFSFRLSCDNKMFFFSLIILVFFSVLFGNFYSLLVFDFSFLFILPVFVSISVLIFIFMGALGYFFSFFIPCNILFMLNFFSTMWYLSFLFSSFFNFGFYKVVLGYSYLIDDSWGEFYMSSYISVFISYLSLNLSYLIFNNLSFYMLSFFLLGFYFIF